MHPDAAALFRRETRQREIIEVDEAVQEMPGGIDLYREGSFGEVPLHVASALVQAAPDLGFMLGRQVVDELLARIIPNLLRRVLQAKGGRRYPRLLYRNMRMAHGDIQVTVCVPPVPERAACKARQLPRMTVCERDCETIRGRVRKPMHAVRREIEILPLFAVGNDRRARRFEPLDGVSNRIFEERSEARIFAVALCDSLDEIGGAWGAVTHAGWCAECIGRCRSRSPLPPGPPSDRS